ncbi:ATP-binding protein [Pseudanabaena phage Pam3]|nr:ATP-binding protein [Pseudanabaena phage Pam3]
MAPKSNAVTTKEQAQLPAGAGDYSAYEAYAGQGLEDISSEDKGLPFFEVLQPLSPEVEDIEGAQAGMIINKATKELHTSIRFVPACRQHVYTEWVPRDNGGGLVATYQLTDPIVQAARAKQRVGKHELPNGNELIETFYLYGMVLDENDNPMPAVIAFSSTKIAAYKTLTTRADSLMFRAGDGRKLKFPWFAHVWRLGTEKKKKDKYTWYTWSVAFDGENDKAEEARLPADHPAVSQGSDIVASMNRGDLKVNTEGLRNDGAAAERGSGGGAVAEDDPPF